MIVTIHQPDFMPWFGFFNKIAKSDLWILLDHVENNPRDARFWGRRVKILVNGTPTWLSIPLKKPAERGQVGMPINHMQINTELEKSLYKSFKTVQQAYAGSPFYKQYSYLVEEYFFDDDSFLLNRNLNFIRKVIEILNIDTTFVRSSSFGLNSSKNELLIDLIRAVGGNIYLCGQGSTGYQDDLKFHGAGIEIKYNEFEHPSYPQKNVSECVHGLSIIDILFNVPIEEISLMMSSKA